MSDIAQQMVGMLFILAGVFVIVLYVKSGRERRPGARWLLADKARSDMTFPETFAAGFIAGAVGALVGWQVGDIYIGAGLWSSFVGAMTASAGLWAILNRGRPRRTERAASEAD